MIDALLGDLPFAVAGEHGAAIRHAPGGRLNGRCCRYRDRLLTEASV